MIARRTILDFHIAVFIDKIAGVVFICRNTDFVFTWKNVITFPSFEHVLVILEFSNITLIDRHVVFVVEFLAGNGIAVPHFQIFALFNIHDVRSRKTSIEYDIIPVRILVHADVGKVIIC